MFDHQRANRIGSNLDPKWLRPFLFVKYISQHRAKVHRMQTEVWEKLIRHVDHFRAYVQIFHGTLEAH